MAIAWTAPDAGLFGGTIWLTVLMIGRGPCSTHVGTPAGGGTSGGVISPKAIAPPWRVVPKLGRPIVTDPVLRLSPSVSRFALWPSAVAAPVVLTSTSRLVT